MREFCNRHNLGKNVSDELVKLVDDALSRITRHIMSTPLIFDEKVEEVKTIKEVNKAEPIEMLTKIKQIEEIKYKTPPVSINQRIKCEGKNKKGEPCRFYALSGIRHCKSHAAKLPATDATQSVVRSPTDATQGVVPQTPPPMSPKQSEPMSPKKSCDVSVVDETDSVCLSTLCVNTLPPPIPSHLQGNSPPSSDKDLEKEVEGMLVHLEKEFKVHKRPVSWTKSRTVVDRSDALRRTVVDRSDALRRTVVDRSDALRRTIKSI